MTDSIDTHTTTYIPTPINSAEAHGTVSVGAIKIHPKDSGTWYLHGLNALSGVRAPESRHYVACLETARTYFENAYIVSLENQEADYTFRMQSLQKLKSISEQSLEWNAHYVTEEQLAPYQNDLATYTLAQAHKAEAFLSNPDLQSDLQFLGYKKGKDL